MLHNIQRERQGIRGIFMSGMAESHSPDPEVPVLEKPFPFPDLGRSVREVLYRAHEQEAGHHERKRKQAQTISPNCCTKHAVPSTLLGEGMSSSLRNMAVICAAASMRSFGIGLLGVVLGVFLYRQGHSSGFIALVIAVGLAGSAAGTAVVTLLADRLGRRRTFFALAMLTAAGALPLIFNASPAVLALGAFLGMLNGMGTDRSAPFALEQAVIPSLVSDQKRTWSFAWYSLVLDAGGALGALAAGAPIVLERWGHVDIG